MEISMKEIIQHNKPLRIFDFDLPMLAVEAAIELDMIIEGNKAEPKSLNKLAQLLSNSWVDLSETDKKSNLDPATISALDQAMQEAEFSGRRISVDDLTTRAIQLAEQLRDTSKNKTENGDLQKLHRFCLALSDLAASYRQQVFDEEPHPMRA